MGNALRIPDVSVDWDKNLKGEDRAQVRVREKAQEWKSWPMYYIFATLFNIALHGILLARSTELIPLAFANSMYLAIVFLLSVTSLSLLVYPAHSPGKALRRILIILMLSNQVKKEIDTELARGKISYAAGEGGRYDLQGNVAIVTGANSGVGYGTTMLLASYGATVVMACRSMDKCGKAKAEIAEQLSTKVSAVGSLEVMQLDLSSLQSVRDFTKDFQKRFERLDYLINNAGAIPEPGMRTKDGMELSLGAMHFGHFALTKWLLPVMAKSPTISNLDDIEIPVRQANLDARLAAKDRAAAQGHEFVSGTYVDDGAARVVFTSSDAMNMGAFHESLLYGENSEGREVRGTGAGDMNGEMTDNCGFYNPLAQLPYVGGIFAALPDFAPCCPIGNCPHSNSYARAKLANVLMAQELQLRYDAHAYAKGGAKAGQRRLVTAAIHPGMVQANIHEFFSNPLTNWFMRSREEAARLVVYATLENSFMPGSYIDGMCNAMDLTGFRANNAGLETHAAAFPVVRRMQWLAEAVNFDSIIRYVFQADLWMRRTLIFPEPAISNVEDRWEEKFELRAMVAARLWEVSEKVIQAFEKKKPLFSLEVSAASSTKLF
jgi:NAD(P)-dependent dehydrogenase (short-subunit alcohol dehydrogenase family)